VPAPAPLGPVISELANIVAAVGSAVAVVVTVVFAVRQLRSVQSANHTLVAIELLTRDRSSDEFLRAEDFVLNELTAHYPAPGVCVSDLPTEARDPAVPVLQRPGSDARICCSRSKAPHGYGELSLTAGLAGLGALHPR
jgi:hypothetical protein